jgi:single-stranded DNA-specific DHH superfamily exonuclease
MVAPRVNAAGRMSTPDIATRLLLASDEALSEDVRALALQLDGENVRRQEEEAEIVAAAKQIVQTDPEIGAPSVIVVAGEGWHRGVIGIVASKLVDAFHRPAIVLSVEDGIAADRAAASRNSTGWARSSAARICSSDSAATGRRRGSPSRPRGSGRCARRSTRSPTRRSVPRI